MTDENKPTDFERFAYAISAAELASSEKTKKYTNGAIRLLEKELNLADGLDLYRGYINDGQIDRIIEIYSKKFTNRYSEATPSQIYDWLKPQLNVETEEQKQFVEKEFNKFPEKKYREIIEEIGIAKTLLELPDYEIHKDRKKEAKKTIEKYRNFIEAENMLKEDTFESLKHEATKVSKKERHTGLVKKLKGEAQDEFQNGLQDKFQ